MNSEWSSTDSLYFGSLSREFYYAEMLVQEVLAENLAGVKRLLEVQKASPSVVVPERGVAALHLLAGLENEHFSLEGTLLALVVGSGNPNVRSDDGLTPVHVAAMWGRCKVLEVLLSHGGDPDLLDFEKRLNAEEYALREHQWRAYDILTTFADETEDESPRETEIAVSDARKAKSLSNTSDVQDYDWVTRTSQVIPLNENAIDMIRCHRISTKVYQFPQDGPRTTKQLNSEPKFSEKIKGAPSKRQLTPRRHSRKEESEMYVCGITESSYQSKCGSIRAQDSTADSGSELDSFKIPTNKMLCKMSRIFLFMLKKRRIHQKIK